VSYGKIFKLKKVLKYIITTIFKCSLRWFFNLDFKKKRVENVRSHFTNPNTYTIAIFANLKKCGGKMP
jgi:hypothetical protein